MRLFFRALFFSYFRNIVAATTAVIVVESSFSSIFFLPFLFFICMFVFRFVVFFLYISFYTIMVKRTSYFTRRRDESHHSDLCFPFVILCFFSRYSLTFYYMCTHSFSFLLYLTLHIVYALYISTQFPSTKECLGRWTCADVKNQINIESAIEIECVKKRDCAWTCQIIWNRVKHTHTHDFNATEKEEHRTKEKRKKKKNTSNIVIKWNEVIQI